MSMLDRYRKPGGFVQLLNLLETSGKEKQEKFLTLIRQEDPRWADALEQRILTIKKIFSWPVEALAEITGSIQEMTLGVAMKGLDPAACEKINSTLSHSQKRKIEQVLDGHSPTPAEISTMFMKILTEVRKMITEGKLRLDKIDPSLVIQDELEEALKKGPMTSVDSTPSLEGVTPLHGSDQIVTEDGTTLRLNFPSAKEDAAAEAAPAAPGELLQLRKKMTAVLTENANLKQEVTKLRARLDQIKKLSA